MTIRKIFGCPQSVCQGHCKVFRGLPHRLSEGLTGVFLLGHCSVFPDVPVCSPVFIAKAFGIFATKILIGFRVLIILDFGCTCSQFSELHAPGFQMVAASVLECVVKQQDSGEGFCSES